MVVCYCIRPSYQVAHTGDIMLEEGLTKDGPLVLRASELRLWMLVSFLILIVSWTSSMVSYPNFVRGPLLDDMQLLFGPCEVLGTHH